VNDRPRTKPVAVSEELFRFIALGQEFYRKTDGAFDITATPCALLGILQRQGRVPDPKEIDDARSKVGMDAVELNEQDRTVFFHKEGMELTPRAWEKVSLWIKR
jgi:thiamine biosynthesis lipoprotein